MVERKVEVDGNGEIQELLCIATFLPIRSWRYIIPFLRTTAKVQKQLEHTHGLARYGLKANLLHKRFWTLTVWQKKEVIEGFVTSEPHAEAVRRFEEWAGEGAAFVEWKSTNGTIDWNTAMQKLQNPTFYYKASNDPSA